MYKALSTREEKTDFKLQCKSTIYKCRRNIIPKLVGSLAQLKVTFIYKKEYLGMRNVCWKDRALIDVLVNNQWIMHFARTKARSRHQTPALFLVFLSYTCNTEFYSEKRILYFMPALFSKHTLSKSQRKTVVPFFVKETNKTKAFP